MSYKVNDIVLVRFPFTDLVSTKKRPALVLSSAPLSENIQIYIVAMITSKIDSIKLRNDVILKEWEKSGLIHPSLVRLSKMTTVESEIIDKKLGRLTRPDFVKVGESLKKVFKDYL